MMRESEVIWTTKDWEEGLEVMFSLNFLKADDIREEVDDLLDDQLRSIPPTHVPICPPYIHTSIRILVSQHVISSHCAADGEVVEVISRVVVGGVHAHGLVPPHKSNHLLFTGNILLEHPFRIEIQWAEDRGIHPPYYPQ